MTYTIEQVIRAINATYDYECTGFESTGYKPLLYREEVLTAYKNPTISTEIG